MQMPKLDDSEMLPKSEFWMRLAGYSFAMWAIVVGVIGFLVSRSIEDAVRENKEFRVTFNSYVLAMEGRVTKIEERQRTVLITLEQTLRKQDEQDGRLSTLENGKVKK